MDQELATLDEQMKSELQSIKDKYASLKKEVKAKYKKIEQDKKKEQKRLEKEELKKTRKSIPKSLKNLVWNKCIGKEKGLGECDVCKCEIDSKNFDCGHIISVKEGGETNESNLLPLCSPCNKSMGPQNLTEFKEKYFSKQSIEVKQTYEDSTEEYIDTCLQGSGTTMRLRDIYTNYISWLQCNDLDEYQQLATLNSMPQCGDHKSGELELKKRIEKHYTSVNSIGQVQVQNNSYDYFGSQNNQEVGCSNYQTISTFNVSLITPS